MAETYNEAVEKLRKIVADIENGDLDVDILSEKVKEATRLIKLCKEKLYKADEEVKKVLEELEEICLDSRRRSRAAYGKRLAEAVYPDGRKASPDAYVGGFSPLGCVCRSDPGTSRRSPTLLEDALPGDRL